LVDAPGALESNSSTLSASPAVANMIRTVIVSGTLHKQRVPDPPLSIDNILRLPSPTTTSTTTTRPTNHKLNYRFHRLQAQLSLDVTITNSTIARPTNHTRPNGYKFNSRLVFSRHQSSIFIFRLAQVDILARPFALLLELLPTSFLVLYYSSQQMDCQQCGRFANMVGWTRAQANSIRAGHGTSSNVTLRS
jgi:hypothetical protein